jgi:hypothetical protein
MNKNQINKSRMYGSVTMVLDNNFPIFSKQEELVKAHQQFKSGQDLIGQYRQIQEADVSGLTKNKTQLRFSLINAILQFSTALRAYANSVKDEELKAKVTYGLSDLKKTADPILVDIGVLIFGLANPLKSDLNRFFIDENGFTELDLLLTTFKQAIPKRRVAAAASKNSTLNISDVFAAQDTLLKEEMDVLMLLFRNSQPDFYNAYRNARSIVDYTGRGKAKTEATLPG